MAHHRARFADIPGGCFGVMLRVSQVRPRYAGRRTYSLGDNLSTMWNRFKKLFSAGKGQFLPGGGEGISFRWHEPGVENPFGVRVLDCQPLTRTMVAMTSDQRIAEQGARLRSSDGKDLIGGLIPDAIHVTTSLRFPHNGASLDGVVFKAPEMEVKWDIYCYDSTFLFARSWTGDLCFRAAAVVGHEEIHITDIECRRSDAEVAASHVLLPRRDSCDGARLPAPSAQRYSE